MENQELNINQIRYQKEKERRLSYRKRPDVMQRSNELAKRRRAEMSAEETKERRAKQLAYMRKWKRAQSPETRAQMRKAANILMRQRADSPSRRPSVMWARYTSNARNGGRVFELSREQFNGLICLPCHYCYAAPNPTNGIDRYDNDLGYTEENAVPCCWMCNHAKGSAPVEEFLSWCARIAEVHRAD